MAEKQYKEGDVDTAIIGKATMWEDAADTLRVVSASKPLPTSDAADAAVLGTAADAAVVTDTTGTISGKIRGLIALWLGGLKASSEIIGKVGIDQTTPGTTNKVVAAIDQTTPGTTNRVDGGDEITISQTPTVTAGAYTAGDAVGGLLTFANAGRAAGMGGIAKDLLIIDDAGQDKEMELWLFNATFTAMADNAPWAPSEADLRKLVGIISTADGAWFAAGTPSVARVEASQQYSCIGTSLFGQLVTRGTPTFAATDDVTAMLGLLRH